jgi:outer membrane protein assembly factor BamB
MAGRLRGCERAILPDLSQTLKPNGTTHYVKACIALPTARIGVRTSGALIAGLVLLNAADAGNWPGFRGLSQSHSAGSNLPLRWSGESVPVWQTDLPGIGQSSPVIWNGKVFVTSIDGPNKESLHLICVALSSGKELWRKRWETSFPEKDSDYISKAAPTPLIDEERLYALFESGDLIAVSHDGNELWRRQLATDYGPFEGNHGQGSSPVPTSRGVVVLMDHKGQSFVASFDKTDGQTQWKTDRNTTSAWSTPLVNERDVLTELIVSASGSVVAYDPIDGSVRWSHEGLEGNNVPSPSTDGAMLLVGSRTKGASLAMRLTSQGVQISWRAEEATSGFGSPLIHKGRAYFVSDAGIAYCYRLNSGELLWDARLGDATWASPLAAGEFVYFFGKSGRSTIIKASDSYEVVATPALEVDTRDRVYGYAVADGRLVFRLGSKLICVGP